MKTLLRAAFTAAFLGVAMLPTATTAEPAPAAIEFNGRPLDTGGRAELHRLEKVLGQVPPGRYWYDPMSGGAGVLGGPAAAYLGPGLALGGPMPASASGGGAGRTTGVFINGRELHPLDVAGLRRYGPVYPGRYWWDRFGNVGLEGGPMLFNFYAVLQQQAGSSGGSTYKPGSRSGEGTYVGKGCAAVHGRLRSSDESSSYSYYVGC
ncbi:MAG: hypothetical protein ABIQ06_15295 [Caldimonas sp.]